MGEMLSLAERCHCRRMRKGLDPAQSDENDKLRLRGGRVAQVVEQCPFKAWVAGSNPAALTRISINFSDGELSW